MKKYYINNTSQSNGDYEVHESGCYWLIMASNTKYLGLFANCLEAVKAAKIQFPYRNSINGCANCSSACHTS